MIIGGTEMRTSMLKASQVSHTICSAQLYRISDPPHSVGWNYTSRSAWNYVSLFLSLSLSLSQKPQPTARTYDIQVGGDLICWAVSTSHAHQMCVLRCSRYRLRTKKTRNGQKVERDEGQSPVHSLTLTRSSPLISFVCWFWHSERREPACAAERRITKIIKYLSLESQPTNSRKNKQSN